jgi:hypothetical protein
VRDHGRANSSSPEPKRRFTVRARSVLSALIPLAVVLAFAAFPAMADPNCKGNACQDVEFRFKNGCHTAKNVGNRRVKASIGAISVYLYPGDEKPFTNLDGSCLAYIVGSTRAQYSK